SCSLYLEEQLLMVPQCELKSQEITVHSFPVLSLFQCLNFAHTLFISVQLTFG
uniref:Uncharacterized protein n=1 Tax=Astatotilapia calliptera TaxID=8154 RepID=A0AAX7U8U2_ASTCA